MLDPSKREARMHATVPDTLARATLAVAMLVALDPAHARQGEPPYTLSHPAKALRAVPVEAVGAIDAAARAGLDIPLSRIIVIGDTPLDVDCAQVHGARSIAVATGPFTVQQLETARPDLVVETLEDKTVRRFLE